MPEIGEKIRFIPTAYSSGTNGSNASIEDRERKTVTGTVIGIHQKHRWYRVAYMTDYDGEQHECFKSI